MTDARASRWRRTVNALTGTARIDPRAHSLTVSRNRLVSLGYALAGLFYMLRTQRNTWLMSAATVVVTALAGWLQVGTTGAALLVLAILIVWLTEFINAAVEAAINTATADYHPMAQVGKDVAAAAVLLAVVGAVAVGLLVLGGPLWARVAGWWGG